MWPDGRSHLNFNTIGQGTLSLKDWGLGPLQGASINCLIDGPGQPGFLPAALAGAWLCQTADMPGEAWPAASSAAPSLFPLAPTPRRGAKVHGTPGLTHRQPLCLLPAEAHLLALASKGRVAPQVARPALRMAEWAREEAAAEAKP